MPYLPEHSRSLCEDDARPAAGALAQRAGATYSWIIIQRHGIVNTPDVERAHGYAAFPGLQQDRRLYRHSPYPAAFMVMTLVPCCNRSIRHWPALSLGNPWKAFWRVYFP